MVNLWELARSVEPGLVSAPAAVPDPLRETDALFEAQLLDVRFEALTLTAGLLFELRTAMAFRDSDTAALSAHGVRELRWNADPRETEKTAWNVMGSHTAVTDGLVRLSLAFAPTAGLTLIAERAAFICGEALGLDPFTIPDYGEPDAAVRPHIPNWDRTLTPLAATFLDARTT